MQIRYEDTLQLGEGSDDENQAPLDGPLPGNNVIAYELLFKCLCIEMNPIEEYMYRNQQDNSILACRYCIVQLSVREYDCISVWHSIFVGDHPSRLYAFKCILCRRELLQIRGAASDCINCIPAWYYNEIGLRAYGHIGVTIR
ncbi:hypothetical protein KPH14_002458 [Odynerus spinipes]|uniref:Uncharacterized protein n=1 Tax=Odynerus spinipes TaxID=1348599 RepID=A0AAD9RGQ5_9HYME|nr:hypothetical protein KPH14_002458 [Odynerus spinipes]